MIPSRPNILLIQSDQHNAKMMGCSSDGAVCTPNLDGLASSGAIFNNAYCASPICVPSRMSMLTGRYPHENEVWTNTHALDSSIPTIAHALGSVGYRSIQIGRMHFIGSDQLHGYDERYIGDHGPNVFGGKPVNHGVLEGTAGPNRVSLRMSGHGQNAYQIHDELVARKTVNYLKEYVNKHMYKNSAEPFFMHVGFMLPHQPYVAHKEDYLRQIDRVKMPKNPRPFSDEHHTYLQWWRTHTGIVEVSDQEILRARTAYWGLVERVDYLIGTILKVLIETGLRNNTLVAYTSDHGDQLGEKGLWWKQTFYEDSVKVPMIISWPGIIPAGHRNQRVTNHFDLNETLLSAGEAPSLPKSNGRNLLELISNPNDSNWNDLVFSEYCTEPFDEAHSDGEKTWQQRMVRHGKWKLIYYHGMPLQLFNLQNDPEELNDLSANDTEHHIVTKLTDLLLSDWNPSEVNKRIWGKYHDQQILFKWAQKTDPNDLFRWELKPEFDYLDIPQEPPRN